MFRVPWRKKVGLVCRQSFGFFNDFLPCNCIQLSSRKSLSMFKANYCCRNKLKWNGQKWAEWYIFLAVLLNFDFLFICKKNVLGVQARVGRGTWNTPFFKPKVKKSLFSITRPKRFWWVDRNKLFYFCTQPILSDKTEVTFVYGHLKTSLESSPGQDYTKTKNNIYINFF